MSFLGSLYALMHGAQGPLFSNEIYPQTATILVVCSVLSTLIYYYGIGGFSAEYNMLRHWFWTMALNSFVCMVAVLAVCRFALGVWGGGPPVVTLMLIQGLYAAVLFALISALVKWWSPNSRRTPV